MARLVLGPMLRYVGPEEATVWVETDGPCRVSVAAGRVAGEARTFEVAGHFYALVPVHGLEPGGDPVPYLVVLDGERAWPPPAYGFPAPVIRPLHREGPTRLLFGSCRVAAPHDPPFTWSPDEDAWGFQRDAIFAYALRMMGRPPEEWPDLIFWCGDQVYADELSPSMQAQIDARRRRGIPGPGGEAVDFEEYTLLYHDSWSAPLVRWFLSVVPSAMVFDDHDVQDDWNTSLSYLKERRTEPWWPRKISSAYASYWIYQHAGNLAPAALHEDGVYNVVRPSMDGEREADLWPEFERFGLRADVDRSSTRWSFCRDLERSKLVVIDSRGGRQLDPGDRRMVDREEWAWIEREVAGDHDHLFLGTSLPWLMTPALHDLESWNEAVAEGAWSPLAERLIGEKTRRAADLEHWPAFMQSFTELAELVRAVGAGEHGRAPETIVALSGDVHHAYLMEARYPADAGVRSNVWQAVCSPMRNPLSKREQKLFRTVRTRPARALARRLRRSAGVADPALDWEEVAGPSFDNQLATIEIDGPKALLRVEKAVGHPVEPPKLEAWMERRLDAGSAGGADGGSPAGVTRPGRAPATSR
jgi:hypothetical protein